MKLNIQLITAAILSTGGLIMLFCGVFIEPMGRFMNRCWSDSEQW